MELDKRMIYDEICRVVTEYEEGSAGAEQLYNMMIQIQNEWEDIISSQEN